MMDNSVRSAMRDLRNVRDEGSVHQLMDDLGAIRRDLAAMMSGRWRNASRSARRAVSDAGDTLGHLGDEARYQARYAHARLGRVASDRPVTTLLVAIGLGMLAMKCVDWMTAASDDHR